jgi:hypothetical protein
MTQDPRSEVHPNLREILARAEAAPLPRRSEPTHSEGANQLNFIIQRISGTSLLEIEKLITELQSLRDHLLNEGQRIQRELTEYTRLNQGAAESTRTAAETRMKMKTGA